MVSLLIVILIEQERAIGHLIVIFNRTTKDRWRAITCDVNRASVVGSRPLLAMIVEQEGSRSANTCDVNRASLVGDRPALAMLIEQAGSWAAGTCDV